jgi:Arc/MetJ family transcription regulator
MGRTTLAVDSDLLETAMSAAGARSQIETIELALRELIRARERERLRRELGSFEIDLTLDDLHRQRRAG